MANGINMPKHHVPAESIAKRHRSLEVDWVACMKGAQVGSRIGFVADVGFPPPVTRCNEGEATAIDRYRGAEIAAFQHRTGVDAQAGADAGGDCSQLFDDSREHAPNPNAGWVGGDRPFP